MRAIVIISEGDYPDVQQHHTLAGYNDDGKILDDMDLFLDIQARVKQPLNNDTRENLKSEIDKLLDRLNAL